MGGCYHSYSEPSKPSKPSWQVSADKGVKEFFSGGDVKELVGAFVEYSKCNNSGFIQFLLKQQKLDETPKEFPEIEYEIKFNLTNVPAGKKAAKEEPTIEQYLDAFDFPAVQAARYIKDSCNNIAEGVNHFLGDGLDERLVVIEKMGKLYLKEKSQPMSLNTGIQYEEIVIKRSEKRWETTIEEILEKVASTQSTGSSYKGRIRKEKGDAFVLDTYDGRIYSFTVNRAHLTAPGKPKESEVQRQLEIEYAGFIPGFPGHQENSEEQLVAGMVSLAKYIALLHNNIPVTSDWRVRLDVTTQRKYDFVRDGANAKRSEVITQLDNILSLMHPDNP